MAIEIPSGRMLILALDRICILSGQVVPAFGVFLNFLEMFNYESSMVSGRSFNLLDGICFLCQR
jgi:hypothetical protein